MSTEPGKPAQSASPEPGPVHQGGPRKLSLVVYSGAFSRVHYALVLASAAAAVGTPATVFFTMGAAHYLRKPCADGTPGWRSLPAAEQEPVTFAVTASVAPGHQALHAGAVDDLYAERKAATFEELLLACAAFGVTFMVCEMGLRVIGLEASALRTDVSVTQGGIVSFLADASEHGAMLFI